VVATPAAWAFAPAGSTACSANYKFAVTITIAASVAMASFLGIRNWASAKGRSARRLRK